MFGIGSPSVRIYSRCIFLQALPRPLTSVPYWLYWQVAQSINSPFSRLIPTRPSMLLQIGGSFFESPKRALHLWLWIMTPVIVGTLVSCDSSPVSISKFFPPPEATFANGQGKRTKLKWNTCSPVNYFAAIADRQCRAYPVAENWAKYITTIHVQSGGVCTQSKKSHEKKIS